MDEVELVADIAEGSKSSNPMDLIVFNNKLYFTAELDEYGRELWEYDALTNQAQIVSDIWPGPSDSDVRELILFNDKLYFSANDGEHGAEIWSLASCLNSFVVTEADIDNSGIGSIDLSVSGGLPPYDYTWDNGAISQDINNLSSGDYTVTIRDQSGCISLLTATVGLISATAESLNQEIILFPNYNDGQFTLQYEHAISYDIVNFTGQVLYQESLINTPTHRGRYQHTINMTYNIPGMYLLRLNTSEGSGVFKFIIY